MEKWKRFEIPTVGKGKELTRTTERFLGRDKAAVDVMCMIFFSTVLGKLSVVSENELVEFSRLEIFGSWLKLKEKEERLL